MGKELLIKGADFSSSAIEIVSESGIVNLTPDNKIGEKDGRWLNDAWSDTSVYKNRVWPVAQGSILELFANESSVGHSCRLFKYRNVNGVITPMDADEPELDVMNYGKILTKVENTGYVLSTYKQNEDEVKYRYIKVYEDISLVDRGFEPSDAILSLPVYQKNDGTFGNNGGGYTAFFNVLKGERYSITANNNYGTTVGFINQWININANGTITGIAQINEGLHAFYVTEGVKRVSIPVGETITVEAPRDSYMVIYGNELGSQEKFPASITLIN